VPDASINRPSLIQLGIVRLLADPGQFEPPVLARYLKVDDQVVSMLLSQPGLDERLARYASLAAQSGQPPGRAWSAMTPALISHAAWSVANGQPLRLYFMGRPGVGKADAGLALARSLRMRLLIVDLERALGNGADIGELVRLALRDAKFCPALPYLAGLDALRAETARGALRTLTSTPWTSSGPSVHRTIPPSLAPADPRARRPSRWIRGFIGWVGAMDSGIHRVQPADPPMDSGIHTRFP
jgi:hypothetical protein